jgi:hypothetical protein
VAVELGVPGGEGVRAAQAGLGQTVPGAAPEEVEGGVNERRDRLARTVEVAVQHWAEIEFGGERDVTTDIYIGHGYAEVRILLDRVPLIDGRADYTIKIERRQ